MREYADYYGSERLIRSWIKTEIDHLYSERKICGASVRKWHEDQFAFIIRQMSHYDRVKKENWSQWNSYDIVHNPFPKRLDKINWEVTELDLYHPIFESSKIDRFLQEGKHLISSMPETFSGPDFYFETKEEKVFYQDIEGRERETNFSYHTLSVLVQGLYNRANTTISCLCFEELNWEFVCQTLKSQLQYQPVKINRRIENSPVILTEEGTIEFIKALGNLFIADNIEKNIPTLWQKQGKRIASSIFTLRDRANIPRTPASRPFDDEGVICQDVTLLSQGVFEHALHSLATSSKYQLTSNGRAYRNGFDTLPKIQYTNLEVEAGVHTTVDLIKNMEEGFLITKSQGGNVQRGRLIFIGDGWRIHKGEKVEKVIQGRIEAPLFQLLRSIQEVGKDGFSKQINVGVHSPSLWINSMSVTY